MKNTIASMVTTPHLTVVMPAHNTEQYIRAAISSILNQTFTDFELWVLENGSNDRTAEIAEAFTDPRVKVFRLGNIGFQGALSYALTHCKSDWIARMDSDDICLPERLETQMKIVGNNSRYVMAGTGFAILTPFNHVIEKPNRVTSREFDKTSIAVGGHRDDRPNGRVCADASMVFSRRVALEVGGYDPAFRMGDVPLWLRMLNGRKGWETAEPLYLYRLLPKSFSGTHTEGICARVKYAPETLDDFLTFYPQLRDNEAPKAPPNSNFWRHIGFMELLAGDKGAILTSADNLELAGNRRSAMLLRMRALTGKIGQTYYSRKWKHKYRHRPDLEEYLLN